MALPSTVPAEGPALSLEERIDLEAFTLLKKNNPALLALVEEALRRGVSPYTIYRNAQKKHSPLTATIAWCAASFLQREAQRKGEDAK